MAMYTFKVRLSMLGVTLWIQRHRPEIPPTSTRMLRAGQPCHCQPVIVKTWPWFFLVLKLVGQTVVATIIRVITD